MAIQFKINGKSGLIKSIDVLVDGKDPIVIRNDHSVANYEVFDSELGRAPERIFAKRDGKDLHISFEGYEEQPDIIIEHYYEEDCLVPIIGINHLGLYQAYIAESLQAADFIINLFQGTLAAQVLGGATIPLIAVPTAFSWVPLIAGLVAVGGGAIFAGLSGGDKDPGLPAPVLETPNDGSLVVNPVPGAKVYEITHLKEGDKRPTKTIVEVDDKGNIVNVTQIAPNGDVFNNPTVDVKVVDGKIVLGPDEIQDGSPVTVVAKDDKGRVSPPATATVGFEDNIETLEVPDTGLLDRNNDGIPDAAHPKVKTDPGSQIEAYIDGKLVSIGKTDPNGNGTVPINLIDDKGQPVDPSRVDIRVSAPGKNPKVVKLSELIDPALPLETPNNTFVKSPDVTATLTGEGDDKTVQIDAKVDKDATELDVRVDSTPDNRSNAPEKTLKLTKDSEGKWTIANPNDFPGAEVDASSTAENPKVNLPVTGNLSNGNVVDAVARNAGGNESTPSNAVKITDNGTEAAPAPTEKSQTPTITVATVKATDESTPADNDPDLLSFGGTGPANAPFTVYKKASDGTLTPVASGTIDAQGNYEVNVSDVGKNQLDTGDTFVVKVTEPGKLESDESNAGTVPAVSHGDTGHTYDTLPPEAPAVATKPNTDDGSAQVTPQNPRPGDEMTVGFKPQKASETEPDTAPVIVKYSFDGEKWTASTPEDERKGLPETFTGTLNIPEELVEDGSTVSAVVTDIAGNHSPQNRGDVGYDNADSIAPTPEVTDIRFIDTSPKADRSGEVLRLTVQKVKEGDTLFLYDDQGNTLDSVKVTADTPKAEGSTDDNPIYLVDFTPPANNPAVKGDKVHLSAQSPNKGQSAKVAQTVPAVRDGHIDDPDAEGATGEDGKPLPAEDTLGDHTEKTKPTPPAILVGGDSNTGEAGNNYATVTLPPDTDIMVLKLTPKGGAETDVRLTKQPDGSWQSSHPTIVPTVSADTDRFTIPAGTLEDNSDITAVAKDIAGNASDPTPATVTAYGASATPTINEDGVRSLDPNGDGRPDQLEVQGKVLNEDGTPVAEGTPVVLKDQNGKPIGTGVTDKDGNYTITTPLVDGGVVDVSKISVEATEKGKAPTRSEEKDVPAILHADEPPAAPVHELTNNPGEVKFKVDPNAKTTTASFTDETGVKQEIEVKHETGTVTKKDGSPLPEHIKVTVDKEGNSFTIDANSIMDNTQVDATSSNDAGDSPEGHAFAGKDKGETTGDTENIPVGQPLTPPNNAGKPKTPTPTDIKVTAKDSDGVADGQINSITVTGKTKPFALVNVTDDNGNTTNVVADKDGNFIATVTAPKGGSIAPNSPVTVRATAPDHTISDPAQGVNVPEKPTEFADNVPPEISGTLNDKHDVVFNLPKNAKDGETVLIRIPSAVAGEPATEVLLTKQGGKWNVPEDKQDFVKVDGDTATVPDAVTGPDVLVTATATDLAGNTATAKVPAGKDNTPAPIIDSGHFVDTSGAHDNNPEGARLKGHLPKKPNGEEYPVGTVITIVDDQNNVVGTGVITENDDGAVKKDGTFDILTVEHPNNPIGPITPETIANFKVIAQEPNKNPSPAVDAPVTGEIAHIGDHTPPAPGVASVDYSGEEPVGKVKLPTNGENTKHPVQEGDQGTITVKDPDGNATFVVGVTFKEGKWVRDPAPEHTEGDLDGDTFTIPAHKLQEGSTVSVVTHDKLGNRSPESSDVVIGQTEPVTELTVSSYDGNDKADRDPDLFDLQGKTSAPAGSQVTIKANGQVVATAIVQAGPNGENTFSVKLKESADNNIKVGDTFTATVEQDGKRPSKPFTSAAVQAPEDFNPADHIGDRTQPTAPVKVVSTEEGNQDKQYSLGDDVERVIVHVVPTGKPDDANNTVAVTVTRGADGVWKSNRPDLVDHTDVVNADNGTGATLTVKATNGTVKKVVAVDLAGNSSESTGTPPTPADAPKVEDFKEDSTAPSPTPVRVHDDGGLSFDLPSDAKEGDHVALTFGKKDPNGGDPTDEVSIVLKKQGNTWVVVEASDVDAAKNKTGKVTDSDIKTLFGLGEPITSNTLSIPRDKVIALGDHSLADDISVSTIGADEHGNLSLQKKAVVEFTATPTNIEITGIDGSFQADKNPERFRITADSSEPDGTIVTAKDKNGKVIGQGVVQGGKVTVNATELNDQDDDIKIGDNITLEAKAPNKAPSLPSEAKPVPEATEFDESVPPADPVLTVKDNGDVEGTFPPDADEVTLTVDGTPVKVVKKPKDAQDPSAGNTYELDPSEPNPAGVTVDPDTGKFTIPAANVPKKDDGTIDPDKVTAQSGDIAGNKGNEVHPTPPAVPVEQTKTPTVTEIVPVNLDNPSDTNPEQLIVRGTLDEPDGTEVFVYDHNGNQIGYGVLQGGQFDITATEKDADGNDIQLGKGQKISLKAKAPTKTLSEKTEENLDSNDKVTGLTHPNDGYAEPPVITPDGTVRFPKDTKEGDITIEREGADPIKIKLNVDDEGNPSVDSEQIPAENITRDPATGEIVVKIPKDVIVPEGTPESTKPPVIKATDKDIAGNSSTEAEREFGAAPHNPDVVANHDGSVDVFFPPHAVVGDRMVVNYDPQDDTQGTFTEVVFEKQPDGSWKKVSGDEDGVITIGDDKISIPEDKVTDNTPVSAYAHNTVARSLGDEDIARPAPGDGTGNNATPLSELSATFVDENEDPADGIAESAVITGKTDPFAEVLVSRGGQQVTGRADKDGNFTIFFPVAPTAEGENDKTPFNVTAENKREGKTPTTDTTAPDGMIFKDKTAPHIDVDPTPYGAEVLFPNKPVKGDKIEVFKTPKGEQTPEQPNFEYTFNGEEWEVTGGTEKDSAPMPVNNRIDVPSEGGSKVKGKITDLAGNSHDEEVPVGEQVEPLPPPAVEPAPEVPQDTKAPSPAPVKASIVDGSVTIDMPEVAEAGDVVNVTLTPTDPSLLPDTLPEGVTKNQDGTITVTMTKQPDGAWSSPLPKIVPPVPSGNTSTTIPEEAVKDGTKVQTQAEDPAGNTSETLEDTAGSDAQTPPPVQIKTTSIDLSDKADNNAEKVLIAGKVPNVPKGTKVFLADEQGNFIAETETTTDDGDFSFVLVEKGFEGKLPNGETPSAVVPRVDVGDNFLLYAKAPNKKESSKVPTTAPDIEVATGDADGQHGGHQGDTTTPEAPKLKAKEGKGEGGVLFGTPDDTVPGDKVRLTLTDENGTEHTVELTHQPDGSWKVTKVDDNDDPTPEEAQNVVGFSNMPSGQQTVEIPEDKLQDGSTVTGQTFDQSGKKSTESNADAGKDDVTATPTITKITPKDKNANPDSGADFDPEEAIVEGESDEPNGTKITLINPETGETLGEGEVQDGKFTITVEDNLAGERLKVGTPIKAIAEADGKDPSDPSNEVKVPDFTRITDPTNDQQFEDAKKEHEGDTDHPGDVSLSNDSDNDEDGSLTLMLPDPAAPDSKLKVGDKVAVLLTPETGEAGGDPAPMPVVLTYEGPETGWTSSHPNLVPSVPAGKNSVVIPEDSIKDGTDVTAFSYDPAGNKSPEATNKAGIDDRTPLNDLVITPIDGNTKADAIADAVQITASTDPGATLGLTDKDGAAISLGNDPVKADDKGLVNVVLLRHGLSDEDKQRIKDHFSKQATDSNGKIATPTFVELASADDNAKIDQPADPTGDKPTLTLTATLQNEQGENVKDPSHPLTGEIRPLQANSTDHPIDGADETGDGKPTPPGLEAPKRFNEEGKLSGKAEDEIGSAVLTLPGDAIVGDLVEFEFLTEGDPNDPTKQPMLETVTVVKTATGWEGLTDTDKAVITGDGNGKSISIDGNTLTIKKDYVKDNSPVRATSIDQAGKKSPYKGDDGKDFVTTDYDEVTLLTEVASKGLDLDETANGDPEVLKVTLKSEAGATLTFTVLDKNAHEHSLTHKVPGDITSPGVEKDVTVYIVEHGKKDSLPNSIKNAPGVVILELLDGADIVPSTPKVGEDGEVPAQPKYEPNVKVTAHVIGEKAPSAQSAVTTPALANDQASHPNDTTAPDAPTISQPIEKLGENDFTGTGTDTRAEGQHGVIVTLPSTAIAGDQVVISYIPEDGEVPQGADKPDPKTVTFTKQADGTWASSSASDLPNTTATNADKVVIPASKIFGGVATAVTAQTIDQAGHKSDSNAQDAGDQAATQAVPKDRQTYLEVDSVTPQDLGADSGGEGSKMTVDGTPTAGQISDKDAERLRVGFKVEQGAPVTVEVLKMGEDGKLTVAFTKTYQPTDYNASAATAHTFDGEAIQRVSGSIVLTEAEMQTHNISATDKVRVTAKVDGKASQKYTSEAVGEVPNTSAGHPLDDTAPVVSITVGNEADKRPKAGSTTGEMEDNPDVGKAFATVTFPTQSDAQSVTIRFVTEGGTQADNEITVVYEKTTKDDKSIVWKLKEEAGVTVPESLPKEIAYDSTSGSTLKIPAEAIQHQTNIFAHSDDLVARTKVVPESRALPVDLVTKQPTLSVKAKDQSIPADGNPEDFIFTLNGEAGSVVTVTITKPAPQDGGEAKTYSFDVTLPGNVDSTQNVTTDGTPKTHTLREHGVTVAGETASADLTVIAQNLGFTLDVGDTVTAVAKATGKAVSPKTADTTIEALTKHSYTDDGSGTGTETKTPGDFADQDIEPVTFSTPTRENGKDSVTATLPRKDSDTEPDVGDGDTVTFTFPYEKPAETEGGEPTNEEAKLTLVYDGTTKKWKVAENGDPQSTGISVEDDGFTVNFPANKIHADRGTELAEGDDVVKITAVSQDLAGNKATSSQVLTQDQHVFFKLLDGIHLYDKAVNNISDRNPELMKLNGEAEVGATVEITVTTPPKDGSPSTEEATEYVFKLLAVDKDDNNKPALPQGYHGYLELEDVVKNATDAYGAKTGSFSDFELTEALYKTVGGNEAVFGSSYKPDNSTVGSSGLATKWSSISEKSTLTAKASIANKADTNATNDKGKKVFEILPLEHTNTYHLDDDRGFIFSADKNVKEADKTKANYYDVGKKGEKSKDPYQYGEDLKFSEVNADGTMDVIIKVPQADAWWFEIGIPFRTGSATSNGKLPQKFFKYTRQNNGTWELTKNQMNGEKILKPQKPEEGDDLLELPQTLSADIAELTIGGAVIAPSVGRVTNEVSINITDLAGTGSTTPQIPVPTIIQMPTVTVTSASFADNSRFADADPDIATFGVTVTRPKEKANEPVTLTITAPASGAEGSPDYKPAVVLGKVTVPAGKTAVNVKLQEATGTEVATGEGTVEIDGSDTATLIVPANQISTGGGVDITARARGTVPSEPTSTADNRPYTDVARGEEANQPNVRHPGDTTAPKAPALEAAPTEGQQGYNVGDNRVTLSIEPQNLSKLNSVYKGDQLLVSYTRAGETAAQGKTVVFTLRDDDTWEFTATAATPTNPFGTRVPTGSKQNGYTFNVLDTDDNIGIGGKISAQLQDFAGNLSAQSSEVAIPDNRFDKDGENTLPATVGYGTYVGEANTPEKQAMVKLAQGTTANAGDVVITPGADNRIVEIRYLDPANNSDPSADPVYSTVYAHRTGVGNDWIFNTHKDPAQGTAVGGDTISKAEMLDGTTVFVLKAAKVANQTPVEVTAYGDNQATANSADAVITGAANFDDASEASATVASTSAVANDDQIANGKAKGDVVLTPNEAEGTVLMKISFTGDADLGEGFLLKANQTNTIFAQRLGDDQWLLFHANDRGELDETQPVAPHFATINQATGEVLLKGMATADNQPVTVETKDAYGNTTTTTVTAQAETSIEVLDLPSLSQNGTTGVVYLGENATHATVGITRKGNNGQLSKDTVEIERTKVTETVTIQPPADQPNQPVRTLQVEGYEVSYKLNGQPSSVEALKKLGIHANDSGDLRVDNYDETGEKLEITSKLVKQGQAEQQATRTHDADNVLGSDQDTKADQPDVVALADGGANIVAGGDNHKLVVDYYKDGNKVAATFNKQNGAWVFDDAAKVGDTASDDFDPSTLGGDGPIKLINEKVDDFTFVTATGYDVRNNNASDTDQVLGDDNNHDDADEPSWKQDPSSKAMIMTPGADNLRAIATFNKKVPGSDRTESKTLGSRYNKETYEWELFEETTPNDVNSWQPFNDNSVATVDPKTGAITISAQVLSPETANKTNVLQAKGWNGNNVPSDPVDGTFTLSLPKSEGSYFRVSPLNDGVFMVEPTQKYGNYPIDNVQINFKVVPNDGNGASKWISVQLKNEKGTWKVKSVAEASSVNDVPRAGNANLTATPPFTVENAPADAVTGSPRYGFLIKNGGGHRLYGDSTEADTDRKADTAQSTTYEEKLKMRVVEYSQRTSGGSTELIADLVDTATYDANKGKTTPSEGSLPPAPGAIKPLVEGTAAGLSKGRVKITADDPSTPNTNEGAEPDKQTGQKPDYGQNRVELKYVIDSGITYRVGINKRADGKWELDDRAKQQGVTEHFANVGEDGVFTTGEGATKDGEFILKAPFVHHEHDVVAVGVDTAVNGYSGPATGRALETDNMVDYRIPGTTKRGLEYYKRWRDSVGKDVVIIEGDVYEGKTGRLSPRIQDYLKNPKYASGARLFEYDQSFNTVHDNTPEKGLRIWGYDTQGGDVYTIKGAVGAKELTGPLKPVLFDLKGGNDILVVENDFGENALAYKNANLDAGKGDDLLVVGASHNKFTLVENLAEHANPTDRFRFIDKSPFRGHTEDAYDVEGKHRDSTRRSPQSMEDALVLAAEQGNSNAASNQPGYVTREDQRTPVIEDRGSAIVPGTGGAIVNANIDMGDGNDAILVTGSRSGTSIGKLGTAAISRSKITTGAGHDSIIIAPNGVEGQPVLGIGTTRMVAGRGAIDQDAYIDMGTGNDFLKTVQISNSATIIMGEGNDTLDTVRIAARYASNSIDMGAGNDTVIIRGEVRSEGSYTASINLGADDDQIFFRGNSDIFVGGNTVNGSFGGMVDGGTGNDTFHLQFGARANSLTDGVHLSSANFKNIENITMEKGTKVGIRASELFDNTHVGDKALYIRAGEDGESTDKRVVDLGQDGAGSLGGFSQGGETQKDGKTYVTYTYGHGGANPITVYVEKDMIEVI